MGKDCADVAIDATSPTALTTRPGGTAAPSNAGVNSTYVKMQRMPQRVWENANGHHIAKAYPQAVRM